MNFFRLYAKLILIRVLMIPFVYLFWAGIFGWWGMTLLVTALTAPIVAVGGWYALGLLWPRLRAQLLLVKRNYDGKGVLVLGVPEKDVLKTTMKRQERYIQLAMKVKK